MICLTSADLVYQILKIIEQEKEPKAADLGVDQKDFIAVLEQVDEAKYASNITFARGGSGNVARVPFANGSRLTVSGRKFINDYESRVK
jgi:hypothetical protein